MERQQRQVNQPGPPGAVSPQSPGGPEQSGGPRRPRRGGINGGDPGGLHGHRGGGRLCSPAQGVDGGGRGGTLGRAAAGRPLCLTPVTALLSRRALNRGQALRRFLCKAPAPSETASQHLRCLAARSEGAKACAKLLHAAGLAATLVHHPGLTARSTGAGAVRFFPARRMTRRPPSRYHGLIGLVVRLPKEATGERTEAPSVPRRCGR